MGPIGMTTQVEMELFATAAKSIVRIPSPQHVLEGPEAIRKWFRDAGIVAHAGFEASGDAYGFNEEGGKALSSFAKLQAQKLPNGGRGISDDALTQSVATQTLAQFHHSARTNIETEDLATFETALQNWYSAQTIELQHFVPCTIILRACSISVGPVLFIDADQWLHDQGYTRGAPQSEIKFGPFIQAMNERSATWVAVVRTSGLDRTLGQEMANLAVDIALVAIQLVVPINFSRNVARITARTHPAWTGSICTAGTQTHSTVTRNDPGLGLDAGAFDQFIDQQRGIVDSVGRRVAAFISRNSLTPTLDQAWCDAAYWLREGLAEPLDTIAVAKLETALEVLLFAQSTQGSEARLRSAFLSFYGLQPSDTITTHSKITVNEFVKSVVSQRSRILHGTLSTLDFDMAHVRRDVELLCWDLLRRSTLELDLYIMEPSYADDVERFLKWVAQRQEAVRGNS